MTDRELMQQALEALDNISALMRDPEDMMIADVDIVLEAATALRERLAQPDPLPPPPECQTEAEKTAYAFGWWKALEAQRLAQPEQEPVGEIVQAFADLTAVSIPVMPPVGTKLYTAPLDRMAENARDLGLDYEPVQEPGPERMKDKSWHHPECQGECIACLIQRTVQDAYGNQGLDYLLRHVTPVSTPPRCPNCASLEAQNTELDAKLAGREWVGLTPEDIEELIGFHSGVDGSMGESDARQFAADLEARLRERNASVLTLRAADKEVS